MAQTVTFVRQVKHAGKPAGKKYADGHELYLLVKAAGKYWRMDYWYLNKRKTITIGVYAGVSLAKARQRREQARALLADGIDHSQNKREEKQTRIEAAAFTFEAVAREWLSKTDAKRVASTQDENGKPKRSNAGTRGRGQPDREPPKVRLR